MRLLSFLSDLFLSAAIRLEAMAPSEPPKAKYTHEDTCRLAETVAPQIHAGIVVITSEGMAVGARTHAMAMLAVMHSAEREGDFRKAERMAERVIHLYTWTKDSQA